MTVGIVKPRQQCFPADIYHARGVGAVTHDVRPVANRNDAAILHGECFCIFRVATSQGQDVPVMVDTVSYGERIITS